MVQASDSVIPQPAPLLHIKVRLPVLLCAVKTVEGDFRFYWTITPNVGQTHKENSNLVRILYMYIEWYIQTVQQITRTLIHKNQFTSLCRGQKTASKCIRLVYEILVICRALQALYTPRRCELMKKKKIIIIITLIVPIGYSLFADHRPVPSFGPGFFWLISAQAEFVHTNFAITR